MKKTRAGAFFAGAAMALYLIWSGLRASGRSPTGSGERAGRGLVKIAIPLVLFLAATVAVFYLIFVNPRMRDQPKATPLRALLPATPEGTVAVAEAPSLVPPLEAAAQRRNPLPDTPETHLAGQVYYGHYCVFCHGEDGRGDGPVGRSYVPAPTDLTAPSVQTLSDGALYRAMLTGTGHAPVLGYVVDPNAPWYIARYVRTLSRE
jgi:mono/diheme cytochrome c family protein